MCERNQNKLNRKLPSYYEEHPSPKKRNNNESILKIVFPPWLAGNEVTTVNPFKLL